MIWDGRDDPDHVTKEAFAKENALPFVATPGDHLGMLFHHGAECAKGIRGFLSDAQSSPGVRRKSL